MMPPPWVHKPRHCPFRYHQQRLGFAPGVENWNGTREPRAGHLPEFDIAFLEVATASNPLGVKGAGQAGCIAAPPTIINAVLNALRHVGVTKIDMPATPEKIWRAITAAKIVISSRSFAEHL